MDCTRGLVTPCPLMATNAVRKNTFNSCSKKKSTNLDFPTWTGFIHTVELHTRIRTQENDKKYQKELNEMPFSAVKNRNETKWNRTS